MELKQKRIIESCNFRHGITLPYKEIHRTFADIRMYNIAIPENSDKHWKSVSGGCAWKREDALLAAIGEAFERQAATSFNYVIKKENEVKNCLKLQDFSLFNKKQKEEKGFPYAKYYRKDKYVNMFSIYDNEEIFVPIDLVKLSEEHTYSISNSTGLSTHTNKYIALLNSIQEVLERDALITTWIHSIKGKKIIFDFKYTNMLDKVNGKALLLDITQDWNPFHIALVIGYVPLRNKKRYSVGVACRYSWKKAEEKAFLEFMQGVSFVNYYLCFNENIKLKNFEDIKTFDDHAVFYSLNEKYFNKLPILHGELQEKVPNNINEIDILQQLHILISKLSHENIRMFYKDLTTVDLEQLDVTCIKVLSPDLTPIYFDEKYPYLGGRTEDIKWRYSWVKETKFPNKYPHLLG